jgi:hypothetical protein
MLKIAVVGNTNHYKYIKAIEENPLFHFAGVFDPSFQFEIPKDLKDKPVFCSFADMAKNADAFVFAATENTYFPLIELALQYSKPVFLHSTYYLNYEEHQHLVKLKDEAGVIIQVYHPFLFHDAFTEYCKMSKTPLLVDCQYTGVKEKNLLPIVRQQVSGILPLFSKSVKRTTASTLSSFSEIPDIINLRLDFNNGSIVNILVNSVENDIHHVIKTYEYNAHYHINLDDNQVKCGHASEEYVAYTDSQNNVPEKIMSKQLDNFYQNILKHVSPMNSIENECSAFKVMEKVKEKIRVCVNIL